MEEKGKNSSESGMAVDLGSLSLVEEKVVADVHPLHPPESTTDPDGFGNSSNTERDDGEEEEANVGGRLMMMRSDAPPTQYTFKITSFSKLSMILRKGKISYIPIFFANQTYAPGALLKYESSDFHVGGYKWRLSLYPDGDVKRGGIGHISLYLNLSEANSLHMTSKVHASFKLFLYDQIHDNYLTFQYDQERCFHRLKPEWGVSKLLPLSTFTDAANGYLVDDCCVFGAEVFVSSPFAAEGEIFSLLEKPQSVSFAWKIMDFSRISSSHVASPLFYVGGHKWYLTVHPKVDLLGKDCNPSLFLRLSDYSGFRPGQNFFCPVCCVC